MRITSIEIYRYSRLVLDEFPRPAYSDTQALGSFRREGLLVRIRSELGTVSFGEVAPLFGRSRETLEEATLAIQNVLPTLAGMTLPRSFREWTEPDEFEDLPSSCRYGIEQAIYGLSAKESSVSLSKWLREDARDHVPVNALLNGSPDVVLQQARDAQSGGYGVFKLKVGSNRIDQEAQLVADVRSTIGPKAELRLDANRAWDYDRAVQFLSEIENQDIAYIEEPLSNPELLNRMARNASVPIALDESIPEILEQGKRLEEFAFACTAILKPTVIGGMATTIDLANRFSSIGVEPVITSSFETEVGHAGLVSLAAVISGSGWAAGLDTLRYFDADLPSEPIREANKISLYQNPDLSGLARVV